MKTILPCIRLYFVLMIVSGGLYPLAVTGVAQVLFFRQATGSLVESRGKPVGSELLSQKTENARYFWPRPSAGDYATVASGASNLGPSSAALKQAITDRATKFRTASALPADAPVPDEMITASGSGLDPEISPEAAQLQIARVAQARQFTPEQREKLTALVAQMTQPPQLGFLGEPRVNVLLLNLRLDQLQ